MLQKIENTFLSILRFVVLAAAAVSLLGFAISGIGSLKLVGGEPEQKPLAINISGEKLINSVLNKEEASAPQSAPSSQARTRPAPTQDDYGKIVKAIDRYVTTIAGKPADISREKVIEVVNERAHTITDENLRREYIVGMGKALEQALGNKTLIEHAKKSPYPYVFIDKAMEAYTDQFNSQVAEADRVNTEAKNKYLADREDGLRSLYYTGACFGTFLMIVFLSIIIKIERNLRYLANIQSPATAREASNVEQQ